MPRPQGQPNCIAIPRIVFHRPAASSIVQTKATVKFATAATPTSHQLSTKEGKFGMKEVTKPVTAASHLTSMLRKSKKMQLNVLQMNLRTNAVV